MDVTFLSLMETRRMDTSEFLTYVQRLQGDRYDAICNRRRLFGS